MSDIIEKLREYAQYAETQSERDTFEATINEITRLRAELAAVKADCEHGYSLAEVRLAERDALREENARLILATKMRPPFDDDLAGEPYAAEDRQPEPGGLGRVGQVEKQFTRLREENARLREALKPFVPETQWIDPAIPDTRPIDVMVLAGELRAARAAILGDVKAEAACPKPDEAP